MTSHIKPESIPIDASTSFNPTHGYAITHIKHQIFILDLTPSLSSLYSPNELPQSHSLNLTTATQLMTATPSPPVIYTLEKENVFGTHLSVKDGEGRQVAEWKSPILSLHMGRTTIKFLRGEVQGETVDVKPTSLGRRSESFVKDNTTYVWEVDPSQHEHKALYKIIEASHPSEDLSASSPIIKRSKREVARYAQEKGYSKEGLLVLDSREIDELVGALTLCAVLEVKDSFAR